MSDLYLNEIGVTKGSVVEEAVNNNIKGETSEVGLYLAMARQAQREGLAEAAEVLKRIAYEEADHAARFVELNGLISTSTKENIEKMLAGEKMANQKKHDASVRAHEAGIGEAAGFFASSSRDEGRHAQMLTGLLERL